jgi:Uma2 family endonuclease
MKDPAADRSDYSIAMERSASYGPRGRKATWEEFLALRDEAEERYEYIDGEIFLMASPKTAHQTALMELTGLFYNWFQGKTCRPFVAPYDIELNRSSEKRNMVQPDLMVICDLDERLGEDGYYKGIPALVVEILSESTRGKDMVRKLDLYMSCGVKEYWIVNPMAKEVTAYRFEDANLSDSATFKSGEAARSFVFEGLSADVSRGFR